MYSAGCATSMCVPVWAWRAKECAPAEGAHSCSLLAPAAARLVVAERTIACRLRQLASESSEIGLAVSGQRCSDDGAGRDTVRKRDIGKRRQDRALVAANVQRGCLVEVVQHLAGGYARIVESAVRQLV